MLQIHILHPDMHPVEASRSGEDERVCGHCPLRHHLGGACYVQIGNGPSSAYKKWVSLGRPVNDPIEILEECQDARVRFGAYGDPTHIPVWLAAEIIAAATGYTAYTHQWRNKSIAKFWKGRAMASCDTPSQVRLAEAAGWKAFVATDEEIEGVVLCDNEESGIKCIDCLRCDGSNESVRLAPHGARQNKHPSRKEK